MSWVAAAIVGGAAVGLVGSSMAAGAARSGAAQQAAATSQAADLQAEVARENIALQREMYEKGLELGKPYREAGYSALTRIQDLLPGLTAPVTAAEIRNLPGFEFAMQQGTGAARQMANVGGGGSNVDRAAQKFAIDYTTGVAMPQVLAQRSSIYNTLAGIAGIGQTATTGAVGAGQGFAANAANIGGATAGAIGQLGVAGANALASGNIASANLMSGGLNQLGNAGFMYALMNRPGMALGGA
jgi:hypothetical protein